MNWWINRNNWINNEATLGLIQVCDWKGMQEGGCKECLVSFFLSDEVLDGAGEKSYSCRSSPGLHVQTHPSLLFQSSPVVADMNLWARL